MSSSLNMFEKIIERVGNISITSLEAISHLSVGQILLKGFDRCLGVIENTATWSLPHHEISPEENGKSFKEIKLVRPLPWIFFLPSLLILRGFRLVWNIGAYILGYPEIQPNDIVRCLQSGRRCLRAIRLNAGKKLRKTRPAIRATTPDEKSATESTVASQHFDSKRKYTNISSDDQSSDESDREPFYTKMERYAILNSSEDEDYNPAEDSSSSSSENEDTPINVDEMIAELKDIKNPENDEFIKLFSERFIRASDPEKEKIFQEIHHLVMNKPSAVQNKTEGNGREESIKQQPEQQMFFSPKNVEDGGVDNAFYSPLTSSSSSPEPEDDDNGIGGPVVENQKNEPNNGTDENKSISRKVLPENGHKEEHVSNCEVNSEIIKDSANSMDVVTDNSNVMSAGKNKQNHYHKGKRSHGNRKKK